MKEVFKRAPTSSFSRIKLIKAYLFYYTDLNPFKESEVRSASKDSPEAIQ